MTRVMGHWRSTAARIFTFVRWLFYRRDPDHSKWDPLPGWKWLWPDFTTRYLVVRALDRGNWPPNKTANWGGLPAVELPDYPPPFRWLSFWARHGGRHGNSCLPCRRWSLYWSRP